MTAFVLWITVLSGPLDGVTYGIPYQTEGACRDATPQVSETLDYDHNLECEATTMPSASIRPKRRPEEIEG